MKNPSDHLQIRNLWQQLYPTKNGLQRFLETYEGATQEPYTYLLVDCKQETPDENQLRTDILQKNLAAKDQAPPTKTHANVDGQVDADRRISQECSWRE